jgi:ribosome-associated translation inhibitor RaiA
MNLSIQLPHSSDVPSRREHAERTLRLALTRFADAISEIRLRLVDDNGPRGGVDQRCSVHVALRRGGTVNVEGVDSDPQSVIKQVAARVARTLARRLSRRRAPRG